MPRIVFSVDRVVGKARPRVLRNGHAFTPEKTVSTERATKEAYRRASIARYGRILKADPHEPVHLTIYAYRPLPKSRPKSLQSEPDTYKADWDNLGKLVSDALTGCAYADDAQVTRAVVDKRPRRRDQEEHMLVSVSWGEEIALIGDMEAPRVIY